ncbi:DUF4247 domain-containing protein [Patulibacter sp. S7RM1-6]
MSPRRKSTLTLGGGVLVAVVALLVLVLGLASCGGSVRGYVRDHYAKVSSRNGSDVYRSNDAVAKVTKDIAGAWKPADRVTDPGGVFLRYRDDLVAIRPRTGGGSEITVDDAERGYAHWYPYVGGWFGTYSGPGEGFRGGGPGSGK